ncbi:MAG TPA: glycogen/starch/alpha-glucan phosphorylase [Gammaproteobacteria bacterium]|nr:glycogen/starch/alpha-glucan phosphorylase [Gammaproteobacteria bacterium]
MNIPQSTLPEPLGLDDSSLRQDTLRKLLYGVGKDVDNATIHDLYSAVAMAIRERLVGRWHETQRRIRSTRPRKVYYLSLEFLMGRTLLNAAINLDIDASARTLLEEIGVRLERLAEEEQDAGLGNGGLGRLAACFLDSMATLDLAGFGYGIRYDYGLFEQVIGANGEQIERPNAWLRFRNLWEIKREDIRYEVRIGGSCRVVQGEGDTQRVEWHGGQCVEAVAYDTPVPGSNCRTVNHLRLWGARYAPEIDLELFNEGDYDAAVKAKNEAENISRVLYPDDSTEQGKELRVKQEYFFVSASLQDILQEHLAAGLSLAELPAQAAIQLNDTHPALAVPELMRLLIDVHGLQWTEAWQISCSVFSYTNHTLLPEALETWPVRMLEKLLPRHLEIVYRINREFLDGVWERYPGDNDRRRRMSIVDESAHDGRRVRMAWLATVGSRKVNGVAELHSELVRRTIFRDFDEYFPGRFVNVTNGVTPRRWMRAANPRLAALLDEHVGRGWENDLDRLRSLAPLADDEAFRARFRAVKQANKERLAAHIRRHTGIEVSPQSLFDVQIKRIHEYKRQLLNLLHVITRYNRILQDPQRDWQPRTVVFAGKAAPAYTMAKRIIQLINNVAAVINDDWSVGERLKVVFLPNYSVSAAEIIIPAADLSEQISTAGMEASGTGNMKFAMNGALTIGTLDGANIEIRDAVGAENIFIFGLTADEVAQRRAQGYYPIELARSNAELGEVLRQIRDGVFSPRNLRRFAPVVDALIEDGEKYLCLADYEHYVDTQERVDAEYGDAEAWTRKSIINTVSMGRFSSDRAIREYAERIWELGPIG